MNSHKIVTHINFMGMRCVYTFFLRVIVAAVAMATTSTINPKKRGL